MFSIVPYLPKRLNTAVLIFIVFICLWELINFTKYNFRFSKYGYEDRRQASILELAYILTLALTLIQPFIDNILARWIAYYIECIIFICILCKTLTAFLITLSKYKYSSFITTSDYVSIMQRIKQRRFYGAICFLGCTLFFRLYLGLYFSSANKVLGFILVIMLFLSKLFYQKNNIMLGEYLKSVKNN